MDIDSAWTSKNREGINKDNFVYKNKQEMSRVPAFLMQSCQLGGKSRLLQQQIRMASTAPLVKIETNEKNGIGLVSLNRPPVNSLSLEFINAIIESIDKCEKENRGLIMTSDNPSIFSAGLDLKEMHKPGEKR